MKSLARFVLAVVACSFLLPITARAHDVWTERSGLLSGASSPGVGAYAASRFFLFSDTATFWYSAAGTSNWSFSSLPATPSFFSVRGAAAGNGSLVVSGAKNTLYSANAEQLASTPPNWIKITGVSRGTSVPDLNRVRYLNGLFVVGTPAFNDFTVPANSYTEILVSTDGLTWESKKYLQPATGGFSGSITDIAFKPGATAGTGTWVLGTTANQILFTAPENLSALTRVNVSNLGQNHTLAQANGVFVLTTAGGQLWTSPTGATWTQRTASLPVATSAFRDIFHDGTRFVAVGATVTGSSPARPTIIHSTDGIVWTQATTVPAGSQPLTTVFRADGLWLAAASNRTLYTNGQSSVTAPDFTSHPAPFNGSVGATITLSATATGGPAPTLQWFRGTTPLVDDARISGATTANLTITGVTFADVGSYTLKATNTVGVKESNPAAVTLNAVSGGAVFTPFGRGNTDTSGLIPGTSPARAVVRSGGPAFFTVGAGFAPLAGTTVGAVNYSSAFATSPSGNLILLNAASGAHPPAVYNVATTSVTVLPAPPLPLGTITSINYIGGSAIADNGDITGSINDPGFNLHAFHYSAATQTYTLLGAVPNATNDRATSVGGISADGATVSGYERIGFFNGPFVWHTTTGFTLLPHPANGGFANGDIRALSPNARFVVGYGVAPASIGSGSTALRWDRGAALGAPVGTALPLVTGSIFADARTVTDDGTVGGNVRLSSVEHAAVWLPDGTLVMLADYLAETYGLNFTGFTLNQVAAISADRRTLAGTATNLAAQSEGWIITLPDPIEAVALLEQTITFNAPTNRVVGAPAFNLAATASSGLDVNFTLLPGSPATLSGNTLTVTGAGFVTILATQPGGESDGVLYAAAEPVQRSFAVTAAAPKASDLVGAWKLEHAEPGKTAVIVFKADGTYYHVENAPEDDAGRPGLENGPYTWAPATGAFTAAPTLDQNGEWGLSHPLGAMNIAVVGDILRLSIVNEGDFFFSRVQSTASALVGAWRVPLDGGAEAILAFLSDGTYFHAERNTADESGHTGMETGTFTWNASTGAVTVATTLDQNGEWGLSHPLGAYNVVVTGNTFAATDGPDSFSGTRISPSAAVTLKKQSIDFKQPAPRTFGSAPAALAATATSKLAVQFSIEMSTPPGIASIGPDGKTLTLTGAGSVTIRATQPGNDVYEAATAIVRTLEVRKASQTITFTLPAKVALGTAVPALNPTSSSDLPIALAITSTVATLEDDALVISAPGTVKVTATQAGDANYLPAVAVTRTLNVTGPALVLGGLTPTYTATPRPITVTGVPAGYEDAVVVHYSGPGYPRSTNAPDKVGTYTVTATFGSVIKTGKLVIKKAELTVKIADLFRLVAQPNPTIPAPQYIGLLGTDASAPITTIVPTPPKISTKAVLSSHAGVYPFMLTGGASPNYTFKVEGALTVKGFGGTYEAILVDGDLMPVGKLSLTIPPNALSFSGTLTTAREAKTVSFKSVATKLFISTPDATSASLTDLLVTVGGTAYNLDLTVNALGGMTGDFNADGVALTGTLAHGARVNVFPKGATVPGVGANTLALHPAYVLFNEDQGPIPGGSGHATAAIAAGTGVLTVKGFVADGLPLTASLKPTQGDAYLLYANPYGARTGSFIAGRLALQDHPDQTRFNGRSYIPFEDGLLIWQKAPLPDTTLPAKQDKSYRAGFGPLGIQVSLDPWIAPATKPTTKAPIIPAGTLAQRLGLTDSAITSATLNISHGPESLDFGDSEDALPFQGMLSAAGALTAGNAAATSWTIKITPTTGAFSGSFKLVDAVFVIPKPPSHDTLKFVPRTVTFSGTLRQTPDGDAILGTGFVLLPPVPVTPAPVPALEQPSGEIRFTAPAPAP